MRYIAKGGSWTLINQGVGTLLTLGLVVAFANLLPKEVYGQYSYVLSIVGTLNVLTLTGMNAAVSRSVAQGKTGILHGSVMYQLKWNFGLLFVLVGLSGYYHFFTHDDVLALSFLILAFFVPATLAFNTYGAYLDGKKAFRHVSVCRILSTATYVAGMFAVMYMHKEVTWLIGMYATIIFCTTLICYIYTARKHTTENAKIDVAETIAYGRELTFIQFIDPIASQIDKVIVGHFWGPAQLAIYAIAVTIPNKVTELMKNWMNIGFPKFANKTPAEMQTVFYRRILQGLSIGAVMALFYVWVSPYFFTYILPQYLESIAYSQLLAVSFIFAIPNRYMSLLFSSQRMSKMILKRSFVMNCINILLYLICGIWGGIVGLIIANILSAFLGFVLNMILWLSIKKV